MAGNSSFDELASLTISEYSKTLADNVSNNIPLWAMMKDAGAVDDSVEGGIYLLENIDAFENSTFTWFDGFQEIPITPSEFATTANYDWKEAGGNAVFSHRQVAQNSGPSKRHDLIKGKIKNLERTITNNVGAALFYAGTEFSGKAFGGLQYIIADDPTTGTVGGINRATSGNEFWRNQVMDESADSITLSATTILDAMELLYVRCTRNSDVPNLWVYGNTYWRYFTGAVNANQRYIRETDNAKARTSHAYYLFKNAKVFHDPNAGATRGYALNTDFIKLKIHKDRNLTPDKPRYPASQRATVIPIDIMANMVSSGPSFCGVMQP
ncbi:MAG TPA: phage major capsid protein [Hyphomonadaceae bacterium]|nr:phage major capsid protein [Hyphomonadaceae bacterium]